jgi:membrane protein
MRRSLLLTGATGLLGGVPSPFFTFGDSLFFTILGWVLTAVAVGVLFSVYYYLGPNREKPTWQWVSVGGVVGAILWILASLGFFAYVEAYGESSYGRTYGSAAGVIVLILWLFLSSLAVLIGGELNAEVERQSERTRTS